MDVVAEATGLSVAELMQDAFEAAGVQGLSNLALYGSVLDRVLTVAEEQAIIECRGAGEATEQAALAYINKYEKNHTC